MYQNAPDRKRRPPGADPIDAIGSPAPAVASHPLALVALGIFLLTYLLIAVQRVSFLHLNRPAAALAGAVAMVAAGVVPLQEAYRAVDLDVLVFLLGVMLLIGHLEAGGFFEWSAAWILRRARTPRRLLVAVVVAGGILSAFFVNDTICLMLTPVLISATEALGLPPVPYLIALAMGSNVGSLLAFTGNPQNMLIGLWSGLSFGRFMLTMLPVVAGGLALTAGTLLLLYRRVLGNGFNPAPPAPEPPLERGLVVPALLLFLAAVLGWLAGGSLPLIAIGAGTLMLVLARRDPTEALARVEWSLLLFFAALFVVMRGLETTGMVAAVNHAGTRFIGTRHPFEAAGALSGALIVLSNLISNVPAVLLWRPVIPSLPDPRFFWSVLAMSATFAGNLLLVGSMANLIVAERAESRGVRIGYWEYAQAGLPVTVLTVAWGILALVLQR